MTDKLRVELIDAADNVLAVSDQPGIVVDAPPQMHGFRVRTSLIDEAGNVVPGTVQIGPATTIEQIVDAPHGAIITVDVK